MSNPLQEAFNRATYPVIGHGKRNIGVLKDALDAYDGELDSDMYGAGRLIEDFQSKMAGILGKEAAVFFPSGTMAQQIALRIWCDCKGEKKAAYHPLCHLEIHEQRGLHELHGIEPVLLGGKNRLIGLADVQSLDESVSCLLLELPQREIGGQLPDYGELEAISAYCRERGIALHLDGARLFEVLPYYRKSAAEICELFDSVYVSFYKGIGGIAGAILAGDAEFTEQSKVWKRRHGGDLISLYPYILSADFYFEERFPNMERYYDGARELAGFFNKCHQITTLPEVPVSNMFHVHVSLPKERLEPLLVEIYEETNVGITHVLRENGESSCFFEVSIGDRYALIPREELQRAFALLNEKLTFSL
ncbi:threonine aldolase family protein [Paenibacillus sabinae]|uniref:Aromatic amino acid beta-eliminating lyase/threonine aldolase n=1 Tax=Paenibacillus sabinae T27 TaxID=1268072 RepID=X4ZED1_9BACL|nr:beta-eliminating lyase-related protein [Paenibacillus sabinae]AHV95160.1 aromatic amino acid beta-eliminating lyase/threonine aldolase [Paenibacillus sabinae T27]